MSISVGTRGTRELLMSLLVEALIPTLDCRIGNLCLRACIATMQNWENGKAFLSRVDRSAAPDFLSFFVSRAAFEKVTTATARRGHSLPHLSSQCQEQSKQNKLRGGGRQQRPGCSSLDV